MEKNREFIGQLKILESANPKLKAVEIMALNSEINRNNWRYVNLQQHLNEFLDIPILTAYVGGGMMLHCGDPIQYANLNTSYWQSHFYAFARPPYG